MLTNENFRLVVQFSQTRLFDKNIFDFFDHSMIQLVNAAVKFFARRFSEFVLTLVVQIKNSFNLASRCCSVGSYCLVQIRGAGTYEI